MSTILGLLGFLGYIAGVVAIAAGVTFLVVKLTPSKKRQQQSP